MGPPVAMQIPSPGTYTSRYPCTRFFSPFCWLLVGLLVNKHMTRKEQQLLEEAYAKVNINENARLMNLSTGTRKILDENPELATKLAIEIQDAAMKVAREAAREEAKEKASGRHSGRDFFKEFQVVLQDIVGSLGLNLPSDDLLEMSRFNYDLAGRIVAYRG